MPRMLAAFLTLAALAAPARAQAGSPPQEPAADKTTRAPGFVLLVTDQGKHPIAGARGTLLGEPGSHLPALDDVQEPASRQTFTGTSGENGLLRFAGANGAEPSHAGNGWVTTDSGLGALFPRLHRGSAHRLELQPMGAIASPTGSEPFQLYARAFLPSGEVVTLPPCQGTEVRLPAGHYEVWARTADGWVWQRLAVAPGQRSELRYDGPAQRVAARSGAVMHPVGRPDVPLFGADGEAILRGAALAAPLTGRFGDFRPAPQVLPGPPRNEPILWPLSAEPPRLERLPWAANGAPPGLQLLTLQRADGGAFRTLHLAALQRSGDQACFLVPAEAQGDAWLLAVAPGFAPMAVPWSNRQQVALQALQRGLPLRVEARDEEGHAILDLAVEYTPDQMDAATVFARTDARGSARLGLAAGPGQLRTSDERFLNQSLVLASIPDGPVQLTVLPGAEVTGRTLWPDGTPAAEVVVTLRDTNGVLRPGWRTVVTDRSGSFRFPGLPEDTLFVVFASTQRDGHTWSGRFDRARAAGEVLELTVRDEDPVLGTGR